MIISVTLKLPAKLKVRVARAARQKGQSIQRWMLETIEHEVERRGRFLAYVKQAQHEDLNLGPFEEIDARNHVHFWLEELSSGKKVTHITPRRAR